MLEVHAPNHIRRKSRYLKALKTRPITSASPSSPQKRNMELERGRHNRLFVASESRLVPLYPFCVSVNHDVIVEAVRSPRSLRQTGADDETWQASEGHQRSVAGDLGFVWNCDQSRRG